MSREFDIEQLVRKNIRTLKAYRSAREEFTGSASVYLDANENAYGGPLKKNYHRYPDPLQAKLKEKISALKGLFPEQIFLGNGSDEVIDLLYRIFCRPAKDRVVICPPTYGMYKVFAKINNIKVKKFPLQENFQLDLPSIRLNMNACRLIFLCSPNNPTGNDLCKEDIAWILERFQGIVVIDEAYGDFSSKPSFVKMLSDHRNLIIMQTFSKAWGMAALRLGMAFACEEVIQWMSKVKMPYNVSGSTQKIALKAFKAKDLVDEKIQILKKERCFLTNKFLEFPDVIEKVHPSSANFLLVKTKAPKKIYDYLIQKGIILRDRSEEPLCQGCLRITIGTHKENQLLLKAIESYRQL